MNSEVAARADGEPSINPECRPILERYLANGEILTWADKPQVRWKQELRRYWFLITFVLVIFIFILSNLLSQNTKTVDSPVTSPEPVHQEPTPPQKEDKISVVGAIIVSAGVATFLGLWCYMMFRGMGGQRLLNFFTLPHTYYGLTDDRLILVSGKKEYRVVSVHLRTIQDLRLRDEPDGIGTVFIGPKDRYHSPFHHEDSPALALKNISRAAQVFNLIFKAQDKLLK
jgi:hypothetical protein